MKIYFNHQSSFSKLSGIRLVKSIVMSFLILAATQTAFGQFDYSDFSSGEGLQLSGNAYQNGNAIRLTNYSLNRSSAFYATPQNVPDGFTSVFRFQTTGKNADGFSFIITNNMDNRDSDSLSVQFSAGKSKRNTISINYNNAVVAKTSPFGININDGAVHTVKITLTGSTLSVYFDENITPIAFASGINLDSRAYVGLASRTGVWSENYDILGWSFTPEVINVAIAGFVYDTQNKPLARAIVTMIDMNGVERKVYANAEGYYRFETVRAGDTYIFYVKHKRSNFPLLVVTVVAAMENLNFTAEP